MNTLRTNTNKYRVRPTKAFILPRVVEGGCGYLPNTIKVYVSKYNRGENNDKECKYI